MLTRLRQRLRSPHTVLYVSIFGVTQIAGVVLSLAICYVLEDFVWGFVRVALVNSLVLGAALVGVCSLTQRLLSAVKPVLIAVIAFALILGVAVISLLLVLATNGALFLYYGRGVATFLAINFLFITALLTISVGLIVSRELMVRQERAIGEERTLRSRIEMQLLTARLNPHFLFNTLNMILNLLKQPRQAEQALLNLSDLLRENLEQSQKPTIPLARELANVRKYLEIQALRFGSRLHYVFHGEADCAVPPLIVQPLVENSIKYNISQVDTLTVEVRVGGDDTRHTISVVDSRGALEPSMVGTGQGLTITKKRVENGGGTFSIHNGGVEISFPRR